MTGILLTWCLGYLRSDSSTWVKTVFCVTENEASWKCREILEGCSWMFPFSPCHHLSWVSLAHTYTLISIISQTCVSIAVTSYSCLIYRLRYATLVLQSGYNMANSWILEYSCNDGPCWTLVGYQVHSPPSWIKYEQGRNWGYAESAASGTTRPVRKEPAEVMEWSFLSV